MDSRLREILEKHEYRHSTDYEMSYCSCGVDTPGREAWLDHIESLESQQPKTRSLGLPPQRSMTPEEVTQASEELGVCNHFPQGPPHRRRNHSNNTNFPCVNWRPLPKGDAK